MTSNDDNGRAAQRRAWRMRAGLLAGTMIASQVIMPARAQTAPIAQASRISVAAGPLTPALNRLAAQTGMQILFDARLAQGKVTNGVQGAANAQQALSQLLAGTGLGARFTGANAATITGPAETSNNAAAAPDGVIVLDTITVDGARVSPGDAPYQTAGSLSYISQEQIERFPGTSTGDIFKSTAGVIAAMNHNGALDVNIRGMQGMGRVKVTIDGTQQTTSTWRGYLGADDRTYVDPDLIAGVSIDKGPSGGAEGAGATGGVVSFRTLSAQDIVKPGQTVGGRVRVGTQDNATTSIKIDSFTQRTDPPSIGDLQNGSGSIALATVQENFDLIAAISKRKSGNYFAGHYGPKTWQVPGELIPRNLSYTKAGEEVFNTSQDTSTALLKATLRWNEDQSIEFGYIRYESTFGETIGSLLTTQDTTYRQLRPAESTVDTYTARYRWKPDGDLVDLRFNVWATDVKALTSSIGPAFYFPPFLTPAQTPPARDMRFSETWTYGTDITNTSKVQTDFGGFKFDYGATYTLEDTNGKPYCSGRFYARDACPTTLAPSIGERTVWSGFSRAEWQVVDWLKFNAGLRYDGFAITEKGKGYTVGSYRAVYADKDGGRLNPTGSITLMPVQGLQFYALYTEGFRPPSLRETIGSDSGLAPNPLLRPEVAKNKEYGINFLQSGVMVPDDKARLKISYFDNNYTDYISRVQNPNAAPGAPFFSVANLEHARFRGVEVSGSYDAGVWFGEAAFTYYTDFAFCRTMATCAQASVANDYALNQLPPKMTNSLTLGTRLIDRKLTLGARVNYAGPRLGPLPTAPQQTNFWLPYTVVDAFASFKATENITFDIKGENLFDRYYVDALNGWMPSPGRTLRLTLTGTF